MQGSRCSGRHCKSFAATRTLLIIGVACCSLAWFALLIHVETVLFSGPVLVLAGVVTIAFARPSQYRAAAWIGAAHIGISLLFFSLVNLLDWGPDRARLPFALMGACYVVIIAPLSWIVRSRLRRPITWGECEECGYLLYGLTEPRCPECGRSFDPKFLKDLAPPSA